MPKIEVNLSHLSRLAGRSWSRLEDLERDLIPLKGELDDHRGDEIKLEFNDTNRPDLWSTAGAARALRLYAGGAIPEYAFFSRPGKSLEVGDRRVTVDPELRSIRPYIAAFAVSGPPIGDAGLRDLIQTQEKLCWNFGRKRRSIAMGVYRSARITWPVRYTAKDPTTTRFVPLGLDEELDLLQILERHPKGREYGHIVRGSTKFPFLEDARGEVLSFPPIINAAQLGAVEPADGELFVELTGVELPSLSLAAAIVACDLADLGYTILPVRVEYGFDTPWGRSLTYPYAFQTPVRTTRSASARLLGLDLSEQEIRQALERMGMHARFTADAFEVDPPPYRNDFLHEVDLIEDVMIGHGLDRFSPTQPRESTIGRLTPMEELIREVRDLMVGLGFQEMIYNYLGSGRDFIERMGIDGSDLVRILNPMTENYEYVRNSVLPNLLESESISGGAVYPHRIFEIGKAARRDASDPTGTVTLDLLGFLIADRNADFNQVNAVVFALAYYLNIPWDVQELSDPRFLNGRAAVLRFRDRTLAVFGEIHPQVLENWGIGMPCACAEWDLGVLRNG